MNLRSSPPSRLVAVSIAACSLAIAACGGDDTTDTSSPAPVPTTAAASTAPGDGDAPTGDFPVTVEHELGSTTIEREPTRVLTIGDFADLDTLLALGVEPVAYGFTDSWATGTTPWQVDAGIDELESFDSIAYEVSLETIVGYEPDLIIGMPTPATDLYDELSAIAPTVVLSWSEPWRDALRIVGEATGRSARAAELQAEVEDAIDAAADEVATYQDRTIRIGSYFGTSLYLQGPESPMVILLGEMGLTVAPGPEPVITELSLEQVPQLADADVLFALATDPAATEAAEANPLWQQLPAVEQGTYTAIDPSLSRGVADGFGALSYDWVLPRLVDVIVETAEGRGAPLT